ncbi:MULTISPECIES: sensor histidine kinase [unclassified Simplicispira]|uniref:sensor histidine kinase n=1 Tax=unclassified Simplicispira TaxID=2630407 RepID=UPI000D5E6A54|nr:MULTISPECIES: sensor histidine kinase [unclassified Simplicispira]PVY57868.1 phospho-acceptor domain-containing protein [Simplicispira sp. 125]REG18813.1 phospho-acceptor domain-containing protein [Simplicispira sp. 110]
MKRGWPGLRLLLCWLPLWLAITASAHAAPVSLEGRLEHFADASGALPFEAVSQADFVRSHFVRLPEFRSLGYGTDSHWFHVELGPEDSDPSHRVLTIGSPELEALDVWVQRQDGSFEAHALGYHRTYEGRPLTRLSVLPLDTFPGMHIYFRVRTTNAISVYAELLPAEAFTSGETRANFFHGLYFGILLIAVALYAILGARLRDAVMAAYAGYVASQLLFHLGATGYLPVLLAGRSAWLMDALPRIGWLGAAAFIVLMWDRLIQLKATHPRIHRLYLFTVALNLVLLFFALQPSLVTSTVLLVVKSANYLNVLNFVIAMGLLVQSWRRDRRAEWMIYLIAFVIPALGALVNTMTNQGLLPWNAETAHFYQIAALVHVLVMSYGLAMRLRQLQQDKAAAEQEIAIVTQRAQQQRHFVAMLSHEFGNPLAAIDRAAQMLQLNSPHMPPKDAQRLTLIRGNAATLSGFVERFLMTEALDNGALSLSRTPCRIRQMLEDTIRQQPADLRSRIRLQEFSEGTFEVDSTLIGVAIGNLLTNALRYSPPDSPVEIAAIRDDTGLRIRVADHGPGLDADELDKLGAPYFRGAAALGKKGSGLGYHFTRRIVEAHGGTLTARSGTDAGLKVEIFLPR